MHSAATLQRPRRPVTRVSAHANGRPRDLAHCLARIRTVRRAVKKAGCDALLITNPTDIRYLTPFRGEDSQLLLTSSGVIVISDFRFEEELEALRPLATVVIRSAGMNEAVAGVIRDHELTAVGVQAEHMTVEHRRALAKAAGPRRFRDTVGILQGARVIKDDSEVALIRRAIRIQEESLLALLDVLEPGQREDHLAARLDFEMKLRGADKSAFGPIVASGANSSLPHAVPGRTRTAAGRVVLIDWGARHNGYVSDMTRVFALGRWPRRMADVYKVVLEAQEAACAAVAPGRRTRDIDAVARDVIDKAGYGPRFGHGLGHGIGLDVHENPRLTRLSNDVLRPGMVVTIEPGVYIPGLGGVRIEDDVLVTARSSENLCSLPKSLEWATR